MMMKLMMMKMMMMMIKMMNDEANEEEILKMVESSILTLSRPRVVTTTPTGVIKKILICPSVLIIESRPQPIYIL